jgi:hypothetical protein
MSLSLSPRRSIDDGKGELLPAANRSDIGLDRGTGILMDDALVDGLVPCSAADSASGYCKLINMSDDVRLDCGRVWKVFEPADECVDDCLLGRSFNAFLWDSEDVGKGGTCFEGSSLVRRGWWEYSECEVDMFESRLFKLFGKMEDEDRGLWFGAPETSIGVLSAMDIGRSADPPGGGSSE